MLITFTCQAHSDITMFGDEGIRLIELMGHSGTVPGAIDAEKIQAALESLESAIEENPQPSNAADSEEDMDSEPAISLRHRAMPLIELLKAATKEKCYVMWDLV
ncbi:MAG: putative secreted protein [Candidatus Azotimanducaceae bacterium]|jgi:predicted secreted protein